MGNTAEIEWLRLVEHGCRARDGITDELGYGNQKVGAQGGHYAGHSSLVFLFHDFADEMMWDG